MKKSQLAIGVAAFLFAAAQPVKALTFVLDFNDSGQSNTTDIFGEEVSTFDVTGFGFAPGDLNLVTNSVLNKVDSHYHNIDAIIPSGQELDIDFVLGDIGTAASNGDAEYYYMQIGSDFLGGGPLGQACVSCVRNRSGNGPSVSNASTVGTIFSDNINGLGGVGNALTSGNLIATTNALAGTISHEIGHSLSLLHINQAGSVTPNGLSALMGTGAIDTPNIDRINDREFAISGFNSQSGGQQQFHIQQLINAVGLRDAQSEPPPPQPVPEPLTILGTGTAMAFGTLFKKQRNKNKKRQKELVS